MLIRFMSYIVASTARFYFANIMGLGGGFTMYQ